MFNNVKSEPSFSSLSLMFNKTPLYIKFNKYCNYFFLTNKIMLINNYYFFYFFHANLINFKKIIHTLSVKRNNYFFLKNILKFKKYTKVNIRLNRFKFKFNIFFKFIFFNKSKKLNKNFRIFKSFILLNSINMNKRYINVFYKNWQSLIGNLISPHYITLFSKKKWIRKSKNFYFFSNKFFNKNKRKHRSRFFNKKHIVNNFFYFSKSTNTNNYSLLPFLIKNNINYAKTRRNNYDFFLARPYLFLNNPKMGKNFKKYPNFLLITLYKKYYKFFNLLRRLNISHRIKNKNSFIFKNFLSYSTIIFKNFRNRNFLNTKPLFNWFSFFKNNEKSCSYLSKKSFKKHSFYVWRFFFCFKSKIFKKNKFYALSKGRVNKHLELIKFSRRIKKANLYHKTSKLMTKLSNLLFTKISWSSEFFFLSFKYFFFYNPFIFCFKTKIFNFVWKNLFRNFFKSKNVFNFKNFYTSSFLIFLKLRKPLFLSKTKTNFILTKYGFIFTNNLYMLSINTGSFYNFKKTMFSFSYKNEIQKYILRKYSKMVFSFNFHNLQSNKFFFNKSMLFSFKNAINPSYLDAFLNKKNEFYSFLLQNSNNKLNWPYFNDQVTFAFNSENEQINFNIKRVKFKPGYMNLWREARVVLKSSLMLKTRYQYKLTNYLSKYKKFINFKTFLFMEMRLFNILIKSRLFNDGSTINLFLKNNLIYVNGFTCSNPNLQLFSGDFVQLIINLKYYILYRWFANLSLKKKNKLKNVLRKKNSNFSQSDEKKKSYSFPKWILYSKNAIDDVSNFLETDYFTLSVFILYEPFTWNDVNTYNFVDQRFSIINLYNWKYIT